VSETAPRPDLVTRALDRLGRSGGPARELAVRIDMVRSVGVRSAWQRQVQDRQLRGLDTQPEEDPYTRIWRDAAAELGAEVTELPGGFLEIRSSGSWTRVQHNLVMLDDGVTLRFALQKPLVSGLLRGEGIPVPEWLEFDASDLAPALRFLNEGPVPCVVKPASSSGGYAVTSGIRTAAELMRARLRAARVDSRLMIERQAHGDFYRFLILEGEVLDVVRRLPPRVTGDGHSTIEELIAAENQRRIAHRHEAMLWPLRVDLECVITLQNAGLTLSSIVPEGTTVPVKTVVSQGTMRDNETVREGIAEEVRSDAIRAAELVGLRLAGVDVITPDIGRPLGEAGGVILEVNGPPGFNYHYDVADPAGATRVAVPILRRLLGQS
jgi:D-alanine-D-alanine ligase-like ATP-grasp enzyme